MSQYLLSTQTLIDIALQDGGPAFRWYDEADTRQPRVYSSDIFISAVTPGLVKLGLDAKPPSAERDAVRLTCDGLIERFVAAGQVVSVTKTIADCWSKLLTHRLRFRKRDGSLVPYSSGEIMVLATAIVGTDGFPYTLVARRQQALTALHALGLEIEDPADLYK
jgi:hypothetical protein